jgi:hypothetical protein
MGWLLLINDPLAGKVVLLDFNSPEQRTAQHTLPAAPTSTTASTFLWMVHSVGSVTGQDRRGSPRFRVVSFFARAVLSNPAGVSSFLARCGSLLVPSKFSTLSASG